MLPALQFASCGDGALTVEFAQTIDARISRRVRALDRAMRRQPPVGVIETSPAYCSLLVHYDCLVTSFAALVLTIDALNEGIDCIAGSGCVWRVPVTYGSEFGFDLEEMSRTIDLPPQEIIQRHLAGDYEVFMVGFLPGFTYLGGLDPALTVPRRPIPRQKVPPGAIVIGGMQTAIGSIEGPSGWHVVGRTPFRAFSAARDSVVLIEPGDRILFERITSERFAELEVRAAAGAPIAERVA